MDAQDFRSLQEAYMEVVENQQLNEDSRRMSNKQKTALVRSNIKSFGSNFTPPNNYDPDANRGQGEVLTRKQIEKKRRKELRQEEVSVYDIILSHLLDEGYADTNKAALAIMANMSEEWKQSIVEGAPGAYVPSRVDIFNKRQQDLRNRGQDVGPNIPGPSGGGQYPEPGAGKPGVLKLARGTSSSNRGVESKNNA